VTELIELSEGADGVWAQRLTYRERGAIADRAYRPKSRRHLAMAIALGAGRIPVLIAASAGLEFMMGDAAMMFLVYAILPRLLPPTPTWRAEIDRVPRTRPL